MGLAAVTAFSSAVIGTGTGAESLTSGYSAAFIGAEVVAAVGGLIAVITLRGARSSASAPEAELVTVDA